ncbi:MAG: SprT family zinc-dependent metalloprotease [Acidobacteriota bacterium]|jgi:predicted metal-dependent hydrolase|nr:SprT family zinc-dependent metalloprotease [Acidobacteriota bacterium]
MNHVFQYGNISFHYKLIREERKTLSVTVLPTQKIIVKAPLQAPDDRIHALLSRKFRWVLKQQRYFHQFKVEPQKEFVSGETFRYRGRSYKLLVRRTGQNEHVKLQHGTLTMFTTQLGDASYKRRLLEDWYILKAHEVFSERLQVCLEMFEYVNKPGLMIRQMTRRWGSYSHKTKRVILNRELIKAATRHIDYVIIHELCHIKHRKHNRAFYDLLASKLHQWQQLKTELELSILGK